MAFTIYIRNLQILATNKLDNILKNRLIRQLFASTLKRGI